MNELMKGYWEEEEGVEVVELALVMAALVAVALIFRNKLMDFVNEALDSVFNNGSNQTSSTGKVNT